MGIQLNPEAVEQAKRLLDEGQYRISTPWREAQPSDSEAARQWQELGPAVYRRWFLAIDPEAKDEQSRYQLPIGDFRVLHRTGLVDARDLAWKRQSAEIAEAAEDILFLFDRLTAC